MVFVVASLYVAQFVLSGQILPNTRALGVDIGGMTVDEAETALLEVWYSEVHIELFDDDQTWAVTPAELGLSLNARVTAETAHGFRLRSLFFGYDVAPVVELDYLRAQAYLLTLSDQLNKLPVSAGYGWRDGELIGVPGLDGKQLEVSLTLQRITDDPAGVIANRRLELITLRIPPISSDPVRYLEDARRLVSQPREFHGYDPFADDHTSWAINEELFSSWLGAGPTGLTLREEAFLPFVNALNDALATDDPTRYLDPEESAAAMRETIERGETSTQFRIRYYPSTYTVVAGDTGFKISRKTGIPFFLIDAANQELDLSVLSPGDTLNLPSRDVTIPLDPIPNKRIVVDLNTQSLVAYGNGEEVFRWLISSGIATAPTSPGIYQIISHEPVAYGSSYTLCGDAGCGQWEMQWFMGIYEVLPGLVNGFHGAVLLPGGTYLGGNNVGTPYTLGCVMSQNDQAQQLYDWAEDGTIVEIISDDFPPASALAEAAF